MTVHPRNTRSDERWGDRMAELHEHDPERPKAPERNPDDYAPVNRHATETVTPRHIEQLDRAIADLTEWRKHAVRALGRISDALPGYPTQAGTGVARPIDVKLEARDGVIAWACPLRRCARDATARGTAHNEVDARRAFFEHHADEHAVDPSTQPERGALAGGDAARRDLAEIVAGARRLAHEARRGADIARKWGVTRHGAKVAEPLDSMWCTSCKRGQHFALRRAGGKTCQWCADTLSAVNTVRAEREAEPLEVLPIEAIEAHARGQRVYERDIQRWATPPATPRRKKGKR